MLLHYDALSEFKRQFFRQVITQEHLASQEIKIDKISLPDRTVDEEFNFWGYIFEKDNIKYLLPSKDKYGNELNLAKILPIIPKDIQKVASKGQVYWYINKPVSVKFTPLQRMSFKELVDSLTNIPHSNMVHRKLVMMMALTQMMDRANFRLCSPPGFGKDSIIDTLGNLVGGSATIENPTIAKLEYMTSSKLLAVNEVIDIPKAEWRNIEQFLLSAGAHKPEITKHSRAVMKGVSEIISISHFSLSLMYNDIDQYPDSDKYFDYVTKKAVCDRFPPFRVFGCFTEDFNSMIKTDTELFVNTNFSFYKDLIYTFTYYKDNLLKELKHWNSDKLKKLPQRWLTNINRLLKIVDLYCDSQEEFDFWVNTINNSIQDYKDMLLVDQELKKLKEKSSGQQYVKLVNDLNHFLTFTEKLRVLKDEDKPIEDTHFWNMEE